MFKIIVTEKHINSELDRVIAIENYKTIQEAMKAVYKYESIENENLVVDIL